MTPLYQQSGKLYARKSKGGYLHIYDITANGKVIGTKTVNRESRSVPEQVTYEFGGLIFDSAKAFIAAYEASLKTSGEGAAA